MWMMMKRKPDKEVFCVGSAVDDEDAADEADTDDDDDEDADDEGAATAVADIDNADTNAVQTDANNTRHITVFLLIT